ncbi:MAG: DUF2829 domain-containing protein, partial [Parabacteroides gordonii]|nr:DUF2829 domain-containing protein [Parabacteroides gordonii]
MKKYIGTKQIEAEPMVAGDASNLGFKTNGNGGDGYHVRYEDGYESWSPKDVFEKAYQVAETHIDRLCIEKKDLAAKFEKCSAFVRSDKFREVVKDDIQAFLLVLQRELMGRYNQVLDYRLFEKSFCMEHMSFG